MDKQGCSVAWAISDGFEAAFCVRENIWLSLEMDWIPHTLADP